MLWPACLFPEGKRQYTLALIIPFRLQFALLFQPLAEALNDSGCQRDVVSRDALRKCIDPRGLKPVGLFVDFTPPRGQDNKVGPPWCGFGRNSTSPSFSSSLTMRCTPCR